jgi:signal transduction histidine kinase
MVDNLLDTTRLEEGAHRPTPQRIAVARLVASLTASASERATQTGVAIEADIPADLTMIADATGLETILGNLLDNALKACAAGHGKSIKIRALQSAGQTEITISDDGTGFPSEDAEMIFEKFYRAGDEMRRATPGTGLGLYIVRRLCELSGAVIRAHSDGPGTGAQFTLTWPELQK